MTTSSYTIKFNREELDTVAKALVTYAEEQRRAAEALRQVTGNRHTYEAPEARATLAEEMATHIEDLL